MSHVDSIEPDERDPNLSQEIQSIEPLNIVCDISINPTTLSGKIFNFILNGPIENNGFQIIADIELSREPDEPLHAYIEVYDIEEKSIFGDSEGRLLNKRKITFRTNQRSISPGNYQTRIYFDTKKDNVKIFDKENVHYTYSETSRDYVVVKRGWKYYPEALTVHPFFEYVVLILTIVSSIGALFEILSFFLKP